MTSQHSNARLHYIFPALVLGTAATLACRPTRRAAAVAPCVFSSPPRSAIAWQPGRQEAGPQEPGRQAGARRGRVIAVGSGESLAHALVRLEPGGYRVQSDSAGAFHLPALPLGRYHLRVEHIGRPPAQDSVTIGEQGLTVLVALSVPPADLPECVRPAAIPPAT